MLHTHDPKVADTEAFAAVLRTANAVWFNGGRQWNIVDSYMNTLHVQGVPRRARARRRHRRQFGRRDDPGRLPRARGGRRPADHDDAREGARARLQLPAPHGHRPAHQHAEPLGRPHPGHPEDARTLLGIGLSEGTAIVVTGDRFEVVGKWKVAIHDNTRLYQPWEKPYFVLSAGDVYNMKTRKIEKLGTGAGERRDARR